MDDRPPETPPHQPEPWIWRRELLALAVLALLVTVSRQVAGIHAMTRWNGDGGVANLMAKHHWEGKLPIYFYGQSYNASLEAAFCAPFYGLHKALFGHSLEAPLAGIGWGQTALAAILCFAIYRLARTVVGRWAALAGAACFALGTMPLQENVGGQNHSYHLTSLIGIGIVTLGARWVEQPTARRSLGLGALFGLGLLNNPQIASFAATPIVALGLRGQVCAMLRRARAVPRGLLVGLALVFAGLGYGLAVCLHAAYYELPTTTILGYEISIARPHKAIARIVLLGLAALGALELWLSPARRRILAGGALMALGALVVLVPPNVIYKQRRPKDVKTLKAPVGLNPARIAENWRTLTGWQWGYQLFGKAEFARPPKPGPDAPREQVVKWRHAVTESNEHLLETYPILRTIHAPWRWTVMVLVGLAALGWCWRERETLLGAARLRPVRATPVRLAALQSVILLVVYLCGPTSVFDKYLQPWWICLCLAVAGAVGWLMARDRRAAIAFVVVVVGYYALQVEITRVYQRGRWLESGSTTMTPAEKHYRYWVDRRRALDYLLEQGVTRGYANYWVAYAINFHTDERIILREWDERFHGRTYYVPYRAMVDEADRIGLVFNLSEIHSVDMREVWPQWWQPLVRRGVMVVERSEDFGAFRVVIARRGKPQHR